MDPELDERFEFLEDGSLLIHEVRKDVVGFYKCSARNSLGKTESKPVELRLLDATRSSNPLLSLFDHNDLFADASFYLMSI